MGTVDPMLGMGAGEADAPLGNDPQACIFKHGVDLASQIAPRGVGLDDR